MYFKFLQNLINHVILKKLQLFQNPVIFQLLLPKKFEPCQQLTIFHYQPTAFQIKIRMKMFKTLKIPSLLHPYPLDCYEYLPLFSRENQASAQRHLESFEDFIDHFQIVHEDVIMRFFSKYLIRDVVVWFKGLRDDSIDSWIEFSNVFVKHWGEHKSPYSYLVDFYAMKKEHNETLSTFNRRFCSIYHAMPLEIRPTETTAMIYYVMELHSKLSLLLLERKSSSLSILFEDALEVEENIHVSRRIQSRLILKICINLSQQNVSIVHNMRKKVMTMRQFQNNNKQLKLFQIVNHILQHLQIFPETGIHINFMISLQIQLSL
jgi:hypothetical protein